MATKNDKIRGSSALRRGRRPSVDPMDLMDDMAVESSSQVLDSSNALIRVDESTLQYGKIQMTSVGMSIPSGIRRDEWLDIGEFLLKADASMKWWIGDWVNHGEDYQWGETYAELAERLGMGIKALYNISLVCRKVHISRRRENLSFSHHQAVSSLEPEEQKYWLKMADDNEWSRKELREAIRNQKPPTLLKGVSKWYSNIKKNRGVLIDMLENSEIGQGDAKKIVSVIDEEIEALQEIKQALVDL